MSDKESYSSRNMHTHKIKSYIMNLHNYKDNCKHGMRNCRQTRNMKVKPLLPLLQNFH
jgi:hypothetical protein